jgi:hypothetical protein
MGAETTPGYALDIARAVAETKTSKTPASSCEEAGGDTAKVYEPL